MVRIGHRWPVPPAAVIASAIGASPHATTTGLDSRLDGAPPDMNDHRNAMNIGQWLVRQAIVDGADGADTTTKGVMFVRETTIFP